MNDIKKYYDKIPNKLHECAKLSGNEKLLLSRIASWRDTGCNYTNETIASWYGVSERTAGGYVSNLCKRGYVYRYQKGTYRLLKIKKSFYDDFTMDDK